MQYKNARLAVKIFYCTMLIDVAPVASSMLKRPGQEKPLRQENSRTNTIISTDCPFIHAVKSRIGSCQSSLFNVPVKENLWVLL